MNALRENKEMTQQNNVAMRCVNVAICAVLTSPCAVLKICLLPILLTVASCLFSVFLVV